MPPDDLSYEFEIAFKKDFDAKMNYVDNTRIDGGIGYDFKLSYDMDIYFLLNFKQFSPKVCLVYNHSQKPSQSHQYFVLLLYQKPPLHFAKFWLSIGFYFF